MRRSAPSENRPASGWAIVRLLKSQPSRHTYSRVALSSQPSPQVRPRPRPVRCPRRDIDQMGNMVQHRHPVGFILDQAIARLFNQPDHREPGIADATAFRQHQARHSRSDGVWRTTSCGTAWTMLCNTVYPDRRKTFTPPARSIVSSSKCVVTTQQGMKHRFLQQTALCEKVGSRAWRAERISAVSTEPETSCITCCTMGCMRYQPIDPHE